MLNLTDLEQRLDKALENETKESLTNWINNKRMENKIFKIAARPFKLQYLFKRVVWRIIWLTIKAKWTKNYVLISHEKDTTLMTIGLEYPISSLIEKGYTPSYGGYVLWEPIMIYFIKNNNTNDKIL
jgi:hypothetical protein